MEQTYGYIRVSSVDQNEIRQRIALEQQAIPPERTLRCRAGIFSWHICFPIRSMGKTI